VDRRGGRPRPEHRRATRVRIDETSDASFFDGLSSILGALVALEAPGADAAVRRLADTATADGWPPAQQLPTENYRPERRFNDATLGPHRWSWRRCGRSGTASRAPAT
jgi:hypothetical protein